MPIEAAGFHDLHDMAVDKERAAQQHPRQVAVQREHEVHYCRPKRASAR